MTVNSVAIARQISEGAFNVVQWSDAFVTRGDDYEISHSGSGRIYSTCQENEAVKGDIRNGPEGVFTVDIPPFSSRTFGHCMRLQDAPLNLQLVSWQTNETGSDLETLVVSTGPQFPKNARRLRALFRAKVYDMSYDAGILELKARSGSPLQDILSTSDFTDYVSYRFGFRDDIPQDERYERLLEPLLAQSLNVQGEQSLASFSLPDDRVRLCVYAPMPDGFYLKNDLFGKQAGYVLYCVDLMRSTGG